METINLKAQQIVQERKKFIKWIEEQSNESLKNLINLILNVFEKSNEIAISEASTDFLVRQLSIIFDKKSQTINSAISFSQSDENEYEDETDNFYEKNEIIKNKEKLSNVICAMQELDEVKTNKEIFETVCSYFENLPGYRVISIETMYTQKINNTIIIDD